jgi:hypothetical protein
MADHSDDVPGDDAPGVAPDLSETAYPQQPEEAERPIPLRRMPERTEDPADWDVAGRESIDRRKPDDVVADRQRREAAARADDDQRCDAALASGAERESGYSTEIEQGAAQPRPTDVEFQQGSDG